MEQQPSDDTFAVARQFGEALAASDMTTPLLRPPTHAKTRSEPPARGAAVLFVGPLLLGVRNRQEGLIWAMLAGCVAAGVFALYRLSGYEYAVVDPQFYIANALGLLREHLSLRWEDLINVFYNFGDPDGDRPRFLMYLVSLLDYHLRYFLYDYFLIPPTLSLSWLFQLVVGPCCLYGLMRNITRDRQAPWLALSVYLSSVGFLSGITFAWQAGKSLSNVLYLVVLFLASALDRQVAPRRLLFFIPGAKKYILLVLLFLGLFLDEMPLFGFPLLLLMFPSRFLPSAWTGRGMSAAMVNVGILALPLAFFFLFSIVLAPMITEHFFHYRFDYIGAILNHDPNAGPFGVFSAVMLLLHFVTLFGSAIVPLESGHVFHLFPGMSLSAPSAELVSYLAVVPLFVLALAAVALCRNCLDPARRKLMARAGMTVSAFVLFFAAVQGRHNIWGYGFYYGSVFAVLFALTLGVWFAAIRRQRSGLRTAFAAATIFIVAMQIHNMVVAQRGVAEEKNALSVKLMGIAPQEMGRRVAVDAALPVNRAVLEDLWTAWRHGHLENRLRQTPIPAGAIYLVTELRYVSHLRAVDR